MIQLPTFAWARLNAIFKTARSAVCLSRILLLIIAVQALTMPITQGLWTWDKFLHGGQDFELGLLITLTCLCLILLRVQQNKSCFGWLAVLWALLFSTHNQTATSLLARSKFLEHRSQIPSPSSPAAFNLPLLI